MTNQLEDARKIINEVDAQMAALFEKRMKAVEMVLEYKKEHDLPIFDAKREEAVIEKNSALIANEALKDYYIEYLKNTMAVSRAYQQHMLEESKGAGGGAAEKAHAIHLNLRENSYDIIVARGILTQAGQYLNLDRRVLVVTDTGVPAEYAQSVAAQAKEAVICTVETGEASKSLAIFGKLLSTMLQHGFSRKDCVVAVGGGVVGDLAGFAASAYMRGIDFYNMPTTLLSQIDSSIGGKTAINFEGVKNIVGAFYQPKKVLIDPDLLKTLPQRQMANGLAEAIKMALTSDPALFDIFENQDVEANLDEIIIRSLNIKKTVVEQDEKETGLRKILNFGHTVGHGIESSENLSELYHGECVALGLIPMCGESIRGRVIEVLKKCGLYRTLAYDWDKIAEAAFHDKKADGGSVTVTLVPAIGSFELKTLPCSEVINMAKECLEEMIR